MMSPELLQAFASILSAIAWPGVAFIFLMLYRHRIGELLDSIETLKVPGGEAKLRLRLDQEIRVTGTLSDEPTEKTFEAAQRIEVEASSVDLTELRGHVQRLAREYERIRATLSAGTDRTKRLDLVLGKMKLLGLAIQPLVNELRGSLSAGDRLAAIAGLQIQPDLSTLSWLVERVRDEVPYVAYQATVALLVSCRGAEGADKRLLEEAVTSAESAIKARPAEDRPNTKMLRAARTALNSVSVGVAV